MKWSRDLASLNISKEICLSSFVKEKKIKRFFQRCCYGFDYREIMNMDVTFALWLYSRLKRYEKWSVHNDKESINRIVFAGKSYTIDEGITFVLQRLEVFLEIVAVDDSKTPSDVEQGEANSKLQEATEMWARLMFYCWR